MTLRTPTTPSARPRRGRASSSASRRTRARGRRGNGACSRRRLLGRYTSPDGAVRELIRQPGLAGSVLVVDVNVEVADDRRLVAHLAADEPADNAALLCAQYLEQAALGRGRCRQVERDDFDVEPFAEEPRCPVPAAVAAAGAPIDRRGFRYRLGCLDSGMSIPQLRWCRHASIGAAGEPVSVRGVVGRLERYEPVCSVTRSALAEHRASDEVSITALRAELRRLLDSPIVLNRALRLAVLAEVRGRGASMSEIATRCGRVKVDSRGHASGETSWLARRLGILPEAGQPAPTPWIHSDVLALIARRGLATSPREVEGDEHRERLREVG